MAGKLQRYRSALVGCFHSKEEALTAKQIVSRVLQNPANDDFSATNLAVQIYKSCVNVGTAYKSRAPKTLFYNGKDRTYRIASPAEIESGLEKFGDAAAPELTIALEDSEEYEAQSTFALEADLQHHLVRNLGLLEKGLAVSTRLNLSSIVWQTAR